MQTYWYRARNERGEVVVGALDAVSETAALAALHLRTLAVTALSVDGSIASGLVRICRLGSRKPDLASCFRSLATMSTAGVPLHRALDVLIAQTSHRGLRESLCAVRFDVEAGTALSEALERRPLEFSPLHAALVRAGEVSGALDRSFERIAGMLERRQVVTKKLFASLTYPLVVACAAFALVLFLLGSIVPTFSTLYAQLHVPLPAVTVALIGLGAMIRSPLSWMGGPILFGAAIAAISILRRSSDGKSALERAVFAVPALGRIARWNALAGCARTLSTLLASGVSILTALDLSASATTSEQFRSALRTTTERLKSGAPLPDALEGELLSEPLFVQLVHVGHETGALDAMLDRLASHYEAEVETAVTALSALLEPALTIVLGTVVATIVGAIFIPLYSLIGNLK